MCGIKWSVFREPEAPISLDPCEDQVLQSYAQCLSAEFLSVWRRVPRRALVTYTYDQMGNQIAQAPKSGSESKNLLLQRKELWVFWYGDKPVEQLKKLVGAKLVEVEDMGGSWENGLTYEARTLLFKALNNLIERSLVKKDFARLGKWFVQPFDGGPDKALHKSTHLSFSFQYFIHGESSVCASIDVRQHPPVRRLSLHHVATARGQAVPSVPVILAPYGLSATLTGVTHKGTADASVQKLLKEWDPFFPLDRNRYFCHDGHGGVAEMPAAVEVLVAGVKMVYPTCYVLVSDFDGGPAVEAAAGGYSMAAATQAAAGSQQTFRNSGEAPESGSKSSSEIFHVEHSAFTASTHPLLGDWGGGGTSTSNDSPGGGSGGGVRTVTHDRVDAVWQDAVCYNPEVTAAAANAAAEQQPGATTTTGSQIMECLAHWDFCNPGKTTKKRNRNGRNAKSRDRNRFNSKVPFHRKGDVIDDLAWTFGQTMMMGAGGGAGGAGNAAPAQAGKMGPPGVVPSPAGSAGPATPLSIMTPRGPSSVKTPGEPPNLNSVGGPPSNGPLTPAADGAMAPRTPKSVPQYPGVASPFPNVKSVESRKMVGSVKQEEPLTPAPPENGVQGQQQQQLDDVKQEPPAAAPEHTAFATAVGKKSHVGSSGPFKRPALPLKEYQAELEREEVLSDDVYDHKVCR